MNPDNGYKCKCLTRWFSFGAIFGVGRSNKDRISIRSQYLNTHNGKAEIYIRNEPFLNAFSVCSGNTYLVRFIFLKLKTK